jgi:predicted transcriptional regulator YheO
MIIKKLSNSLSKESRAILESYIPLVAFLGNFYGPHCEVVLHDVSTPENSVVAIANGYLSGRTVGAPMTDMGLKFLQDATYRECDFVSDYTGSLKSGQQVCASTFFIKNGNALIGFLCLNMDTGALQKLREDWGIVMYDYFRLGAYAVERESPIGEETFSDSIEDLVNTSIKKALSNYKLPPDRLSQQEKTVVLETLYNQGFFQMRGAVESIAEVFHISEATVYRYLKRFKKPKRVEPKDSVA